MTNLPPNWNAPDSKPSPVRLGHLKPAAITVGVAFILLAGSIYGTLSTCGSFNSPPSPSNKLFFDGAIFFLVLFVASLAWLILSLLIWCITRLRNPVDR